MLDLPRADHVGSLLRPSALKNAHRAHMEKKIDDAAILRVLASRHARDQFRELGTGGRQGCNGRKQRIEDGGAHGRQNAMDFDRFAR